LTQGPSRPLGHQRLFVAAAELTRLAASGPGLLLIVDDAHDADDASLRLLHYLARTATDERVLFVVARRSNVTNDALDEICESLRRRDVLTDLDLAPLDLDDTRALVRRHAPDVREEAVQRLWAVSGGIPFAITELATRGEERLDSAVVGVDEQTRDTLQRVAIAGMQFDTDEFVALSGLDEAEAFNRLDAALAARVVERAETGYRFRHALVRDALLADVPPHRFHLLHAGDRQAVPYLLDAAESEAAIGAYRDALALVDAARAHVRAAHLARLSALRGDLLFALGDPDAAAAYRDALDADPTGDNRLLRAKLGRAALFAGDLSLAGAALRDLELRGDAVDSTIMLARANYAYAIGDVDGATELAERARAVVEYDAADWQLLDLIALQGLLAHNRGEWFEQLRLELQRTRDAPYLANAVFDGHLCVAEYLLYGPVPYREVVQLAESLRNAAARAGALRAVAFAAALAGEAALLGGDLVRAENELQEAVDLHREISATAGEAHSLQRFAELRLVQGRKAEARDLLQRALPLARWSSITLHLLQRIYGTMILAAESPTEAHEVVLMASAALGRDDECTFCQVMFAVPATIACADAGDLDGAHAHLTVAERSAANWHGTAWHAAVLEARAHLAAAESDGATASDLLEAAAAEFERAGQPLDADRCRAGLPVATR
jgi:hypothetical protein